MGKMRFILSMGVALVLASCGTAPREAEPLRPVKVAEAESLGVTDKSFSGVVMPDQYSNLAFKVGGPLVQMNVVEGQRVRKGELVAEIDPIDYRLQYEATRSSYVTAKSQLERAEKLLAKDAISRQDFESTRAHYDNAKASFENAESLLKETKLRAPFDGFVQKKFVENYQKVQAGTSVVCLIDPSLLQIRFLMPEANMEYFLADPELYVEFENYKGTYFKARVKEYVPASSDGSGVPVFLRIDDSRFNLKEYNVSVGFTCRVILRHTNPGMTDACTVPISAIVTKVEGNEPHVFVFNAEKGLVEMHSVKQEGITGRGSVIITEGLKAGEQVVVAGATRLTDGQNVKVL